MSSGEGFKVIDKDTNANPGRAVEYKFMPSSPPSGFLIEKHANNKSSCVLMAFRGVCLINPFDVDFTATTSGNGDPNSPLVTTVTNTAVVVSVGLQDDDGISVLNAGPSGYNNAINGDCDSAPGGANSSIAWVEKTPENPEDPGIWDLDTSDAWKAYSIVLCPADKTGSGECCEVGGGGRTRRMF